MSKIFYIMGKSSTGKDTIFKHLLADETLNLKRIVPYTTRPIRIKEKEGVEYHFTDENGLRSIKEEGRLIEVREYNTFQGIWKYFTALDNELDVSKNNYIIIGTIESYIATKKYFGEDTIVPILVELSDGDRLQRALNREKKQEHPKYEELCRRFLADAQDFSEENILRAGITKRFQNEDLDQCVSEIKEYIQWILK